MLEKIDNGDRTIRLFTKKRKNVDTLMFFTVL